MIKQCSSQRTRKRAKAGVWWAGQFQKSKKKEMKIVEKQGNGA